MKKYIFESLIFLLITSSLGVAQATPFAYTFALQPISGMVTGAPGELAGWGYSLTNEDSDHWLVTTELNASSFTLGTPDASYFDFPILAPSQTLSTAFDPVTHSGLYGLQFDGLVLPGQMDMGTFTLVAEWWSGDPFSGGSFLQNAVVQTDDFSAIVAGTAPVPEPQTGLLTIMGLALLVWFRQRIIQKIY